MVTFAVPKETTASSAAFLLLPVLGSLVRNFLQAVLQSSAGESPHRLLCYTSASTPTACVAQALSAHRSPCQPLILSPLQFTTVSTGKALPWLLLCRGLILVLILFALALIKSGLFLPWLLSVTGWHRGSC